MADALEMTRVAADDMGNSKWMFATISMTEGTYSDPYLAPREKIYAIAAAVTDGTLQLTYDPPSAIADDSAVFVDWDGTTAISPAITGFRLKLTPEATSVCKVMIKTEA